MGLTPHTPNNQIVKLSNKLIPQTTNRKTVPLVIADPVHGTVIVIQVAVPCTPSNGRRVQRRTPPATVVTNVMVIIGICTVAPHTARKT